MPAPLANQPPYTCTIHTAKLLELRIEALASVNAVADLGEAVRRHLERGSADSLVLVSDWRRCSVLTPPVAEALSGLLQRNSPAIRRTAMLVSAERSTSLLQLSRVVTEAANEKRRVFTDPAKLTSWLHEDLDAQERARLQVFLASRM